MRKHFVLISVLCVMFLSATVRAETFYASLSGAQEVPAAATNGKGYARVFVNEATLTLTFTVVFSGLTGTQTASHIHAPAAIGANSPVAIDFGTVGGNAGTITGTRSITATQLSQIRAHQGYVNVHTTAFPGGEIRGQLGIKRPVDFDGDGRQDLSVLRFPNVAPPGVSPITYINRSSFSGTDTYTQFGDANRDFPAPGDYDGDGMDDLALFRIGTPTTTSQSVFYILRSSDGTFQVIPFGTIGDRVVARDYDGDGVTDPAVFRPGATLGAQATWWLRYSSQGGTETPIIFGGTGTNTTSGDLPVPGDYDGDGKFDLAVYRFGFTPANHYIIRESGTGFTKYRQFGNFQTDYILPGDYDGDGKYDLAVMRVTPTSPPAWWIENSSTGGVSIIRFGINSDIPVQGDYDGDARTDLAVYRGGATAGAQGNFWIRNSLTGTAGPVQFGSAGDFAVAQFDAR